MFFWGVVSFCKKKVVSIFSLSLSLRDHSQVLVYDWSEPGDMEVVVEDVEAVNLDEYGLYEEQQADWRLYNEENANRKRYE